MAIVMSKIETTSNMSLELTSRINFRRQGACVSRDLDLTHSPLAPVQPGRAKQTRMPAQQGRRPAQARMTRQQTPGTKAPKKPLTQFLGESKSIIQKSEEYQGALRQQQGKEEQLLKNSCLGNQFFKPEIRIKQARLTQPLNIRH